MNSLSNPVDCADFAIAAQGAGRLSKEQVRDLVVTAAKAYKVQQACGLVEEGTDFDTWRRSVLADVCGKVSFRAVTQAEYCAALARFTGLGSDHDAKPRFAAAARTPAQDEARRAAHALADTERGTAAAFGGPDGAARYADSLLARIHHTNRLDATARQLWCVVFTLRNRAAKKLRPNHVKE